MLLLTQRAQRDQMVFRVVVVALIALAWIVLWTWGQSPYGRFLSHDHLGQVSLTDLPLLLVFVSGWTLMTIAMMLPTSLPLVDSFRTLVQRRRDRTRLVLLLVSGYLAVWTLFGAFVHLGDWGLHRVVQASAGLQGTVWLLPVTTLVLAGVYQLTPLKFRFLDRCRSPLSLIVEHWRGRDEARQALQLGLHHGMLCLGCCWSLMLLMFAIGVGNLGWMLMLGAVMAMEKNLPSGWRLSRPLGVLLIGWGLLLIVLHQLAPVD